MKRSIVTLAVLLAVLAILPASGFANSGDPRFAQPAFAYPVAPQVVGPGSGFDPARPHFHHGFRPPFAHPGSSQWVWWPGTWYWNGLAWAWMPGRWVLEARPGF